jgi:hypothetical protein
MQAQLMMALITRIVRLRLLARAKVNNLYQVILPTHLRCAIHTLSLIGTTDASKALKNPAAFSVLFMLLWANFLPYGIPAEISRTH